MQIENSFCEKKSQSFSFMRNHAAIFEKPLVRSVVIISVEIANIRLVSSEVREVGDIIPS